MTSKLPEWMSCVETEVIKSIERRIGVGSLCELRCPTRGTVIGVGLFVGIIGAYDKELKRNCFCMKFIVLNNGEVHNEFFFFNHPELIGAGEELRCIDAIIRECKIVKWLSYDDGEPE